jgi:3-deoxy-D-manno-octulosonate 8-phosphate phosphatase (KDO 8-P phosphatase)
MQSCQDIPDHIADKAKRIKWVVTDCDGVLTDTGVYYSADGEMLKRFSIRDGMGVERLRTLAGVDTAIVTGENSLPLKRRAEKLHIRELYLYVKNKEECLLKFCEKHGVENAEIAYIGDDFNDEAVLKKVGLSACPSDAIEPIKAMCDYICVARGGQGAFRDLAELIISCKQ